MPQNLGFAAFFFRFYCFLKDFHFLNNATFYHISFWLVLFAPAVGLGLRDRWDMLPQARAHDLVLKTISFENY